MTAKCLFFMSPPIDKLPITITTPGSRSKNEVNLFKWKITKNIYRFIIYASHLPSKEEFSFIKGYIINSYL